MDKKEVVKILSFAAMFDGCLTKNDYRSDRPNLEVNASLKFDQIESHRDFVEWIAGYAQEVSPVAFYEEKRELPRHNMVGFRTRRLPFYTAMRDRIYVGSYKSIDPHALKLLDAQALAIAFMADGGGRAKGNFHEYTISTARLSYGDTVLFQSALREKLGLVWNINKTNRKYTQLYLAKLSCTRFEDMLYPHILPSFHYKLIRTFGPTSVGGDIV
jgi:hypothetical protein